MDVKNVVNNGAKLSNECNCIWCGGTMKRGVGYMGAGVNQFALWCDNCGAVIIHAKESGKKITGFYVKFDTENIRIKEKRQ